MAIRAAGAAMRALRADELDKARTYVSRRRHALEEPQKLGPYISQSVHGCNVVDDALALRAGDVERATALLLDAGESTGSPTLNTFGPNMIGESF